MSILFDDARLSTRPHGRWTTGLWLSLGLHAIVAVVLIVAPIRASEKPSGPIKRSRMVFILPATQLVKVPTAPPGQIEKGAVSSITSPKAQTPNSSVGVAVIDWPRDIRR